VTTTSPSSLLARSAVELAGQGYAVFPLRPGEKVPLVAKASGGQGCKDATRDPGQIQAWWEQTPAANVGVATGTASGGLLVVDVDGWDAADRWTALVNLHGYPFPSTVTVLSGGRRASFHYYLRLAEGVALGNSAGRLAEGVDTRCEGGYVVAPPSVHPDGGEYHWLAAPVDTPIAAAPAWLVELLTAGRELPPRPLAAPRVAIRSDDVGLRILAEECDRVAATPAGQRNQTAFARAAAIGNLVAGGCIVAAVAAAALIEAAQASGLSVYEAEMVVMNGLEHGAQTPRALTLHGGVE
jgi:Bifunctional DNA primase/polymerase, N-terminal